VTRWFYRSSQDAYRGTRGAIAKIIVHFVETMNGMRAVQAFRREGRNEQIMDGLNGSFQEANRVALSVVARFTSTVRLVGNVSLALVLGIGAVRVAHGGLEIGVLAAFTLYLRRFYDPLDDLGHVRQRLHGGERGAGEDLRRAAGVARRTRSGRSGAARAPARRDPVADVEFRYSPDTPIVLPSLDLRIPSRANGCAGWPTGAGKSTVAKLVAPVLRPVGGRGRTGRGRRAPGHGPGTAAGRCHGHAGELPVLRFGRGTTSRWAAPARTGRRSRRPRRGRRGHVHQRTARGLRHGRPQSAAAGCPPASARWSRSPGPCWPTCGTGAGRATSSLDVPTERAVQDALETVLTDRTALIIAHALSTS